MRFYGKKIVPPGYPPHVPLLDSGRPCKIRLLGVRITESSYFVKTCIAQNVYANGKKILDRYNGARLPFCTQDTPIE